MQKGDLSFLRIVIEAEPQMAKYRLADDALAKLPVKERVACLIRLLPDETGEQLFMPGECDIFAHDRGVSRWRSFPPGAANAKLRPATARAQMKRNAEAWWKETSGGREADLLDREISADGGKQIVGNRIERLAQIAPERIFGAVERSLAHAGKSSDTDSLVQALSTGDSEPARTLMRKTVTKGRSLKVRMTAARRIHQSGGFLNDRKRSAYSADDRRAAREAMLREWKAFPTSAERRDAGDGGELAELPATMMASDASMYAAIAAEMPRHSANVGVKFITSLTDGFPGEKVRSQPPGAVELESFLRSNPRHPYLRNRDADAESGF